MIEAAGLVQDRHPVREGGRANGDLDPSITTTSDIEL